MQHPQSDDRALRAGAQAFLLKTDGARVFAEALAAALRDETYVSPAIRDEVERLMAKQASPTSLTPRQREILALLARGLPMKQVARELDITPRTVAFHKYRIIARFEIDSSAGLVRLAIQDGLVAPPSKPTTS